VFEILLYGAVVQALLQPVVDIGLQRRIARQQDGLVRPVERRLRMHRAQLRMQVLLQAGFDGVGDHQVGGTADDLAEDGYIVRVHGQLRVRRMGAGEAFVGAARIDDQPHLRPVDLRQRLEAGDGFAACDGRLAIVQIGHRKQRLPLPLGRHRHAAQCEIELVRTQVGHQRRPAGRHQLQPHAERARQLARQLHIHADELAICGQVAEGLVVAGTAHAQHAARGDVVQLAGLCRCLCRCQQAGQSDGLQPDPAKDCCAHEFPFVYLWRPEPGAAQRRVRERGCQSGHHPPFTEMKSLK